MEGSSTIFVPELFIRQTYVQTSIAVSVRSDNKLSPLPFAGLPPTVSYDVTMDGTIFVERPVVLKEAPCQTYPAPIDGMTLKYGVPRRLNMAWTFLAELKPTKLTVNRSVTNANAKRRTTDTFPVGTSNIGGGQYTITAPTYASLYGTPGPDFVPASPLSSQNIVSFASETS